jgi:hypothetical protein
MRAILHLIVHAKLTKTLSNNPKKSALAAESARKYVGREIASQSALEG